MALNHDNKIYPNGANCLLAGLFQLAKTKNLTKCVGLVHSNHHHLLFLCNMYSPWHAYSCTITHLVNNITHFIHCVSFTDTCTYLYCIYPPFKSDSTRQNRKTYDKKYVIPPIVFLIFSLIISCFCWEGNQEQIRQQLQRNT